MNKTLFSLTEIADTAAPLTTRRLREAARWYDGNPFDLGRERMEKILSLLRLTRSAADETALQQASGLPEATCRELMKKFRQQGSRPVFIGMEGLDGSGKTVQCSLLAQRLKDEGNRVFLIDFPQYTSALGQQIGFFLSGKDPAVTAKTIDPRSMCLWYAADRWKALSQVDFSRYDYVIFNRYTLSSAVYQTARQFGQVDEAFMNWVFTLEHSTFGLPAPDVYIFLDTAMAGCADNLQHKGERTYVEGLDVYESSKTLLETCREIYRWCTGNLPGVCPVYCSGPEGLLPAPEISAMVYETLQKFLN